MNGKFPNPNIPEAERCVVCNGHGRVLPDPNRSLLVDCDACKGTGRALKKREGDQDLPIINDETDIQTLVIEDINKRREVGIQRYGTALQPFNGRDALRDAYEEAIDLTMYLKQLMVERDALAVGAGD